MCSASLIVYRDDKGSLEELSRDYIPAWTTALEFIDEDNYVVGEHNFNLYSLRKQSDGASDSEKRRLEITGQYHLGDVLSELQRNMAEYVSSVGGFKHSE
ncbi:DNA damage-binding protein 1a [Irineochytrium annulatum]|nr:DNA damage-binding protein 1a [Irineochytrium annulatum]